MNTPIDPVTDAPAVELFENSRVRGAPPGPGARRRLRAFAANAAADAELRWLFNEAEIAIDQPSNFQGMLTGDSPTSLKAVERRAEAMHAARTIVDRLRRLRPADAQLLAGLYTERPWSRAVTPRELIASQREQLEVECANAVHAYELVRRGGPSVVPEEDG